MHNFDVLLDTSDITSYRSKHSIYTERTMFQYDVRDLLKYVLQHHYQTLLKRSDRSIYKEALEELLSKAPHVFSKLDYIDQRDKRTERMGEFEDGERADGVQVDINSVRYVFTVISELDTDRTTNELLLTIFIQVRVFEPVEMKTNIGLFAEISAKEDKCIRKETFTPRIYFIKDWNTGCKVY